MSHSPSLRRLEHQELSPPAPGSRPAATDLPALVMIVLHFVTSVRGCYPSRFGHAVRPSFRSGVVSSSAVSGAEISGGRNQRLPLTQSAATHTSSAPSRRCSYQQALAGLSWLSFSPCPRFARDAEEDGPRSVVSPQTELPTLATVERTSWARTPGCGFAPLRSSRPQPLGQRCFSVALPPEGLGVIE